MCASALAHTVSPLPWQQNRRGSFLRRQINFLAGIIKRTAPAANTNECSAFLLEGEKRVSLSPLARFFICRPGLGEEIP
jgi:hypothetical protein